MLHVTATAASESRNDGAVRRNCYWLDRGVAHITSERKRWVGGGSRKSDGKKNGGNAFHLYMRSVHVELLVNMPDVHERTALAQLEIRRRGGRR